MTATDQEINKRLRSLHQDFDFLLDNNVISSDLYDQLVEKIPRRYNAAGKSTTTPAASSPAPVTPATDSVDTLATRLASNSISSQGGGKSPPPPPVHAASPPPAYGVAQAEALYNYSSPDEGDLPLIAGQKITVLEYDWWRGEGPNGQQGIFPSNYVRKIEGSNEKGAPQYGAPVPYQQYGGGYPGQQYQQQPVYQQPQYVAPQPQPAPVQQEEQKQQGGGKLAQFGKNYGKTFVNATAWGGGMTLGADVINKIF